MRFMKGIVVAFLAVTSVALAFGQMTPTGKLTGTVTDDGKAPLPGVSVKISSPSLILPEMATVTNEAGLYRFFSLPSGTYKVVFELQGFKTGVREGIIIRAQGTVAIDMVLAPGEINESITVVGQSPTVDMQKTQTGSTFTTELIETLPLARDLSSIFNSAPGMFARTSHGSDARSNNFIVDGVKMQDPVTGDPYQTVPWNAIDEVEIETSNQKAEYGAVKGALVNVITKAGGNEFSGGVNFYFRDKSLQSTNTRGHAARGPVRRLPPPVRPRLLPGRPHRQGQAVVLHQPRRRPVLVLRSRASPLPPPSAAPSRSRPPRPRTPTLRSPR
ncbi:MAG: carboxypeptidase regulatory-like domain-containing protein [Candidatus Moduliflexus flocculans]|nr:carboxypeptidase regulatory-like domain-containing protein [Candidatus Moduliflexus flocculans]